jgi:UDP-N-acetylglucosamine 4,6-dehydratase
MDSSAYPKLRGAKIFITGGAGYLGRCLIDYYYEHNDIVVYSRDEAKHYYLTKKYPKVKCIIGDVRDYDSMLRASKGCTHGIFAASMKQISAVDMNTEAAVNTILIGGINSRKVAEDNGMQAAIFISSDKSRSATTIYGSLKFAAGEMFIVNTDDSSIVLSSAIYGNVLNSTGSIIPLMWDAIQNGYPLQLYDRCMTRFFITAEEAAKLIDDALTYHKPGYNFIPKVRSFMVWDLFDIFKEKFKLEYTFGIPRVSEKIHEVMISKEEMPRVMNYGDYFLMHYKNVVNDPTVKMQEYSSQTNPIGFRELCDIMERVNYFKP